MDTSDPPRDSQGGSTEPEELDGVELTQDDLEIVVGGLSPAASAAYLEYLRDPTGRRTHAARLDRLRLLAGLRRRR
jgi:hypothetical protein